ncbi:hypothetical protein ACIBQ1_03985 [Nonomuraea sp. NPDC050153]|uniref:hypothetical protein n=1 Tax=Nonomuraea sp. NPDC050153 TaxID=3364359 RepID=UPI0037ACD66A
MLWQHGDVHVGHPAIRALRAAVFTAACVLASAALHVLVGGGAMRPGGLAAAMPVIWAGAYLLAGRRRAWPELLALCAVSQYGLHQLFSGASAADPVFSSGHEHGPGLAMPVIHLAVAAGSSWWLARGELALATLLHLNALGAAGVRTLLAAAITVLAPLAVIGRPRPVPVRREPAPRVPALLAVVVPRRGPPAVPAARG